MLLPKLIFNTYIFFYRLPGSVKAGVEGSGVTPLLARPAMFMSKKTKGRSAKTRLNIWTEKWLIGTFFQRTIYLFRFIYLLLAILMIWR